MTELLDVLRDGQLDQETVAFLVEALSNAEPSDWDAILEPFVQPGPVLDVLTSYPNVLEQSAVALAAVTAWAMDAEEAPEAASEEGVHRDARGVTSADFAALEEGLLEAGFTVLIDGVFVHVAGGVSVETLLDGTFDVAVDGKSSADVAAFVATTLTTKGAHGLGRALFQWGSRHGGGKQVHDLPPESMDEGSDASGSEGDANGFDPQCIPSSAELGVNRDRELAIVTWGFFKLQKAPEAQAMINCSYKKFHYLTRNNKHIKRLNGLHDVVQGRICRNTFLEPWLREAVRRIESEDLVSVSLCCAKGTHLSVAVAEIMRKAYYPRATVRHLTLAHNRPGHAGGAARH